MKNFKNFICLALLFIATIMHSQDLPPELGSNILNLDIDKFVGTWYWEGTGKSLKFILKKENVDFMPITKMDYKADLIVGFHKFVENGIIIEDSTPYYKTFYNDKKKTVSGCTEKNDPGLLTGNIHHKSKKKLVNFKIQFLDNNHIKLLEVKNTHGIKVWQEGETPYDSSISLPSNIILTRQ